MVKLKSVLTHTFNVHSVYLKHVPAYTCTSCIIFFFFLVLYHRSRPDLVNYLHFFPGSIVDIHVVFTFCNHTFPCALFEVHSPM